MSFNTRDEFITAQSSEKVTLAHVHGSARLFTWTLDTAAIYTRNVDYYVYTLKQGLVELTRVDDYASLVEGSFYYNPLTTELFVWTVGSTNPQLDEEMIVTYRFFFSSVSIDAPWDLADTSPDVRYDGRIQLSPGYKHKIAVEQNLVSIIGNGSLKLLNNDGGLDALYDTIIFDNHKVTIFSWNRQLAPSLARTIYRGRVVNKRFQPDNVSFEVKDVLFDLDQNVPQDAYTDDDSVTDNVKGRYKRWVYGRVDGLRLQSISQIGSGYALTGTGSINASSEVLTGIGTLFLAECSPGDKLTIGTQEFTIASVESNTALTLDSTPEYALSNYEMILVPEIPTIAYNRQFFVAGHATAELTKTVVSVVQFNRVVLSDVDDIEAGDFLEFATGERVEVKNTAPGNIVVLQKNLIVLPTVGTDVIRQPIQSVYIGSKPVFDADYTIVNQGPVDKKTLVTIADDAEFNLAKTTQLGITMTFTNGSRTVTSSGSDLREILNPRDYVRPSDLSYTTYYEILAVDENELILRTVFGEASHSGLAEAKMPDYIGDETVVSANVLGKTVDGTPSGVFIKTAAQVMRDLIREAGITEVNETSFTNGASENAQTISMALPLSPTTTNGITYKRVVDLLSRSVTASLTLDNDLNLKYKAMIPSIPDDPVIISDFDVVDWNIETNNGKNTRNTIVRYRHTDVDRYTLEDGTNAVTYSSGFVEKYIGTNKTDEIDVYLYNQKDAETLSHRNTYFQSLARSDISITTDLRFEDVEIGDTVILDFRRFYFRFGDPTARQKVVMVVGKTLNGERTKLDLSDLGNIFNRSSVITPNAAPDFTAATALERLKYGYITANNGIVNDDESTYSTHLIS